MQCTPSIECQPKYEHLAAGVVSIYAVDPQTHTIGLCSGEHALPCTAVIQCVVSADTNIVIYQGLQLLQCSCICTAIFPM